jgi:hypothetical protein
VRKKNNLRNLIGVTLTDGLGGEEESTLLVACERTHCEGCVKIEEIKRKKGKMSEEKREEGGRKGK